MEAGASDRSAGRSGQSRGWASAGEVMAAVQTAILAKLPYQTLRDAILAHPTMAEGLGSLLENVQPPASDKVEQPLAATA